MIRSLLEDLGYIDKVVGVLTVRISKRSVLTLVLKGKHKLNISETHRKVMSYVWGYITTVCPLNKQLLKKGVFASIHLCYLVKECKLLGMNLQEYIDKVLQNKYTNSTNRDTNNNIK